MKLADEAVEKIAEVLIQLGEASILAGVGSFFVKNVQWYFGFAGIFLGAGLIIYGVYLIHKTKSRSNYNGRCVLRYSLDFYHGNDSLYLGLASIAQTRSGTFKKVIV